MKPPATRKAICAVTVLLLSLCPTTSLAHVLSPTYYPLGHWPIYLPAYWWPFSLLIPLTITVETIVLWRWTSRLGFLGSLWRAAVLYVVARAGETAMLFLLTTMPRFRMAGWSSSAAENFGPLALFLAAGLVLA
jgi:hypothetical protein